MTNGENFAPVVFLMFKLLNRIDLNAVVTKGSVRF